MMVVLHDEFGHLADGVRASGRHVAGDIRDFGPYDDAVPVAQIIEVLVVLIVGESYRVRTHLADQRHILVVLAIAQCVADAGAVLMACDGVERVGASVEYEPAAWIDTECAHAERYGHLVHDGAVAARRVGVMIMVTAVDVAVTLDANTLTHMSIATMQPRIIAAGSVVAGGRLAATVTDQRNPRRIPVGVIHPIPQPHVGYRQRHLVAVALCHHQTVGVHQPHLDMHVDGVGMPCSHVHHAVDTPDRRQDPHAMPAMVIQIDMLLRHDEQPDIPIDAAVEREIGLLRIHAVVHAVVDGDLERVPCGQRVGDVGPERGVPAVMMHDMPAVQRHVGRRVHPEKLQIHALRRGIEPWHVEYPAIPARSTPVVVAPVLTVPAVPRMGQIDRRFDAVHREERPILVDGDHRPVSAALHTRAP